MFRPSRTPGGCDAQESGRSGRGDAQPYNGIDRHAERASPDSHGPRPAAAAGGHGRCPRSNDIGRIENVHFNPWWSNRPKLFQWQMANGRRPSSSGGPTGNTSTTTFCFGYKVGYRFTKTRAGVCNGNFLGIGRRLLIRLSCRGQCSVGLLITNGEFVSFHGPERHMIEVKETNKGSVRFRHCAYWGRQPDRAGIGRHRTVGFSDCTLVQWGGKEETVRDPGTSGTLLMRAVVPPGPAADRAGKGRCPGHQSRRTSSREPSDQTIQSRAKSRSARTSATDRR